MHAHDRARRASSNGKAKAKPTARKPIVARNGAVLNGVGSLLAEVLAIKGVGEIELDVAGTRLLVRPRR